MKKIVSYIKYCFKYYKEFRTYDIEISKITKQNTKMTIMIKDSVGLNEESTMMLINSLLQNRKPKENSFDYGLETHGAIGVNFNYNLDYPIQVFQSNKRKSAKDRIAITIERHRP